MRIGLFGGSFNPIHNGHIALGTAMLKEMKLDEVWYMVSPQNPLKATSTDLAGEDIRLRLVQLALQDHEGLKASDYEFHLPRPSYTWNTLQNLKRDYPDDDFILIIGGDNWECFDRWAHHDEILHDYEIAIYPREGAETEADTLPQNVHIINVPLVNVTSTMLRKMIREGKDITPFTTRKVAKEVEKSSLYR